MKRGETVEIQRLESGLYKIIRKSQPEAPELVGGVETTVVSLINIVFGDQAREEHVFDVPDLKGRVGSFPPIIHE